MIMTETEMREHLAERLKDIQPGEVDAAIAEVMAMEHDYGTVCVAIGCLAAAACYAADRTPNGGITGFQASAVMWEFIRAWGKLNEPARLVRYGEFLYPQYASHHTATLSVDTWKWLQEQATERLATTKPEDCADAVYAHWRSIVDGVVPFGYRVEETEDTRNTSYPR